jgi:hypothetical protein
VTEVRPEQLPKAHSPIFVTEFGIVIEDKFEQLLKAPSAIPFVPSFITICVFAGIVPLYL